MRWIGGGLPSSEEEAAYNRAKKRRPTEYTEYAEIQTTETDAVGIKKHRRRGNTEDRDRCRRHQNTRKNGKGFDWRKGVSGYT
jgi:hypothetical protein